MCDLTRICFNQGSISENTDSVFIHYNPFFMFWLKYSNGFTKNKSWLSIIVFAIFQYSLCIYLTQTFICDWSCVNRFGYSCSLIDLTWMKGIIYLYFIYSRHGKVCLFLFDLGDNQTATTPGPGTWCLEGGDNNFCSNWANKIFRSQQLHLVTQLWKHLKYAWNTFIKMMNRIAI